MCSTGLVGMLECGEDSAVELFYDNDIISAFGIALVLEERAPPRYQNNHRVDTGRAAETDMCCSDISPPRQNFRPEGASFKAVIPFVVMAILKKGGDHPRTILRWKGFLSL